MTSYQRLKEKLRLQHIQYEELFDKLVKIIDEPDSEDSRKIKHWVAMNRRFKMYSMLSLLEKISDFNENLSKPETFSWNVLDRNRESNTK